MRRETLIRVDRSIPPKYPDYIKGPLHPELESHGPDIFDASRLCFWLHSKQKKGFIPPFDLYEYLKEKKILEDCLGLRDLEEIQNQKGRNFFRQYFGEHGDALAWKSIAESWKGKIKVPYLLCDKNYGVYVAWHEIRHPEDIFAACTSTKLKGDKPALRFGS
jgi:hypothetical protein